MPEFPPNIQERWEVWEDQDERFLRNIAHKRTEAFANTLSSDEAAVVWALIDELGATLIESEEAPE